MVAPSHPALGAPSKAHSPDGNTRVLRWVFRRSGDAVTCELELSNNDSAYQLRILPWNPIGPTAELFADAMSAFQRHAAVEKILVKDGWSLDTFEITP